MEANKIIIAFVLVAIGIALATALGGVVYNATNLYRVTSNETIIANCTGAVPQSATTDHKMVYSGSEKLYWFYNSSAGYNGMLTKTTNYTINYDTGALVFAHLGDHNSTTCVIKGTYDYRVGYVQDDKSRNAFFPILPIILAVIVCLGVAKFIGFKKR